MPAVRIQADHYIPQPCVTEGFIGSVYTLSVFTNSETVPADGSSAVFEDPCWVSEISIDAGAKNALSYALIRYGHIDGTVWNADDSLSGVEGLTIHLYFEGNALTETVTDENGIDSVVTKNYRGVYIREGEQVEFRKVDVIYEGSNYVLSAVHTEDPDYLSLYDDIMIEGVDSDGK